MSGFLLKTAVRSVRRRPAIALVNILGLAVGLACFILITWYIREQNSFDRFHSNADRIVRVVSNYEDESGQESFARTSPAVGPAMEKDLAPVEQSVRFQRYSGAFHRDDLVFNETEVFYAEGSVFDVFSFPLIQGDPSTALTRYGTAVLTRSAAQRYFPDSDPMGKTIVAGDSLEFVVTGVAQDVPARSHLRFDILLSFETYRQMSAARGRDLDSQWTAATFYTYALLSSPQVLGDTSALLADFVERYRGSQEEESFRFSLSLQPITEIHLHSHLRQELGPNASARSIRIFGLVAIFILVISCVNFMNLATARSTRRAREVGLRKALGVGRSGLIRHFLGESVLMSGAALFLASLLVLASLPGFNHLAGTSLTSGALFGGWHIPLAIGFAVLLGLLAGAYPAFLLSAHQPAIVLKGGTGSGGRSSAARVRHALVVFQFALSIGFLTATIVTRQQLAFMQNADTGFDSDQIVVLPYNWDSAVTDRLSTLKSQWKNQAAVRQVTASGDVPGRMFTSMSYWMEGMPEADSKGITLLVVDPDFAETYGLTMVAGRDFTTGQEADLGASFLLNEAAVRELGREPDEVIGQRLRMNTTGPVIGVVKDFHFEGLQSDVTPLIMTVWPGWFGYVSLRVDTDGLAGTLAKVEETWKSVLPARPFEYFFLDEDFDQQYRAEQNFGELFTGFSILAMFISCLGLFGLAVFSGEARRKEIGVRKTLGASVPGMVLLLSRTFTIQIGTAFLIAAPITWFLMERWLQQFAFRIQVSPLTVLLAGIAALLIGWTTVGYLTVRSARMDPVDILHRE